MPYIFRRGSSHEVSRMDIFCLVLPYFFHNENYVVVYSLNFLNTKLCSIFRNFKTAHVVQLIGVVSQGTPPLVLLEMMKNGSLKEYLHSLRASKKQEERRPTESVRY